MKTKTIKVSKCWDCPLFIDEFTKKGRYMCLYPNRKHDCHIDKDAMFKDCPLRKESVLIEIDNEI